MNANLPTTTPAAVAAASEGTLSQSAPSEAFCMAGGVLHSSPGTDQVRRNSPDMDCLITNPIANPSYESLTSSPVSTTRGYPSGKATVAPAETRKERCLQNTLQGMMDYTEIRKDNHQK